MKNSKKVVKEAIDLMAEGRIIDARVLLEETIEYHPKLDGLVESKESVDESVVVGMRVYKKKMEDQPLSPDPDDFTPLVA